MRVYFGDLIIFPRSKYTEAKFRGLPKEVY